jgi:hypothetical protein
MLCARSSQYPHRLLTSFFISTGESALAGIAALVPVGSAPELSHKRTEPRLSCRACGTYLRGRIAPGNNSPIRHVPTLRRYVSDRPPDRRAWQLPRHDLAVNGRRLNSYQSVVKRNNLPPVGHSGRLFFRMNKESGSKAGRPLTHRVQHRGRHQAHLDAKGLHSGRRLGRQVDILGRPCEVLEPWVTENGAGRRTPVRSAASQGEI